MLIVYRCVVDAYTSIAVSSDGLIKMDFFVLAFSIVQGRYNLCIYKVISMTQDDHLNNKLRFLKVIASISSQLQNYVYCTTTRRMKTVVDSLSVPSTASHLRLYD
jgi:hypothetical protein